MRFCSKQGCLVIIPVIQHFSVSVYILTWGLREEEAVHYQSEWRSRMMAVSWMEGGMCPWAERKEKV